MKRILFIVAVAALVAACEPQKPVNVPTQGQPEVDTLPTRKIVPPLRDK